MNDQRNFITHPPGLILPTSMLRFFTRCKYPNKSDMLVLYINYAYIAQWQQSKRIWATTNYLKQLTGMGDSRIKKARDALKELGLIRMVRVKDERGRVHRHKVEVYYYATYKNIGDTKPQTQPIGDTEQILQTSDFPDLEKLGSYNNNKEISREATLLPDRGRGVGVKWSKKDKQRAKILRDIIVATKNVKPNIAKWPDEFRKLRKVDKVSPKRIDAALEWYSRHIEDKYTPAIYSGKAFREKFLRLENAMKRSDDHKDEDFMEQRIGPDGKLGYYARED